MRKSGRRNAISASLLQTNTGLKSFIVPRKCTFRVASSRRSLSKVWPEVASSYMVTGAEIPVSGDAAWIS